MNIIDGYPLILPPCGIKSFLSSYLKALARHNHGKIGEKYTLIIPDFQILKEQFDTTNAAFFSDTAFSGTWDVQKIPVPSWMLKILWIISNNSGTFRRYFLFLWEFFLFPRYMKTVHTGSVFHPYQVMANYPTPAKKYVVVHDVFHWVDMGRYNFIQKYFYREAARACMDATRIITISQFSKGKIMKHLGVPEDKIAVCFEGIDYAYLRPVYSDHYVNELKNKYHLPAKFLLSFLSERMYKKNNIAAVKILHELKQIKPSGSLKLVYIGGTLETNAQIKKYILENGLINDVIFIGTLEDPRDLTYLYHLSSYFVFLSLEEGFGLPPLEAFACGTFPLVSSTSSLGEIYSSSIPTFHPQEEKKVAEYISNLTEEKRRHLISEARTKLLHRFNWDTVIPHYLTVMKPFS